MTFNDLTVGSIMLAAYGTKNTKVVRARLVLSCKIENNLVICSIFGIRFENNKLFIRIYDDNFNCEQDILSIYDVVI